jgi:hypothetical protein
MSGFNRFCAVPAARAFEFAKAISSLAAQRALQRPYLMLLVLRDARKDAVTTLEPVSASEGAAPSLKMIALVLSTRKFGG